MSYEKTKNEIFGSLLFLTDIVHNEQILIDLLLLTHKNWNNSYAKQF